MTELLGSEYPAAATNRSPVVADMSIFLTAGRQKRPAKMLEEAVEAEQLGLRRGFLSERYDIKLTGPLLGGAGALTTRLELGTGVLAPGARHPVMTASLMATLQAVYGERFILGIGRGNTQWMETLGLANEPGPLGKMYTLQAFADYVDIIRRLWTGEKVTYDGPAGRYDGIFMADPPQCAFPPIWYGMMGGPKAARLAAKIADGALMLDLVTPAATEKVVKIIRDERERLGLDSQFRIASAVITTPDFDETQTINQTSARLLTYLVGMPSVLETFSRTNGWDKQRLQQICEHPIFQRQTTTTADLAYYRHEILEAARLVPIEWMRDACAIGSTSECVTSLQRFRDAGADEIVIYGSTPSDNAGLIDAWRNRAAA